jgi:hypothetical protein
MDDIKNNFILDTGFELCDGEGLCFCRCQWGGIGEDMVCPAKLL